LANANSQKILDRVLNEFLSCKIMDNSLRGYWCEAMVAEALGPDCKVASQGWHPWDLQFGPDTAQFPARVRIQVKNSARIQTWNVESGKLSNCQFDLKYSKRPFYFERDFQGVPCEEYGFMCDVFVLCYHSVEDASEADQTDPDQWEFFIVPVAGGNSGLTASEVDAANTTCRQKGRSAVCQRRPSTLKEGIRGRPKISPLRFGELTASSIFSALAP
jgi:hypothetical protein